MIPTSQHVADRAGVSRSTVSQILNGRADLFSEDTRARVAEAITELGYQPSAAGRTLARGASDIVIALIPNTTFGGNLQDIFGALTGELAQRGLTLVLRLADHTLTSLDQLVVGMKPRAVITLAPLPDDEREILVQRGVEILEPAVTGDADFNAKIGTMQARYLIGRGYRRLAYAHLRDERGDPFGDAREQSFAEECRAHGLDEPVSLRLDTTPEGARTALESLSEPGFAVGCYNDDVATALLFAAAERGWQVPQDLALIGMDNTPMSRLTIPALTTMGYDTTEVAAVAVQAILSRLDAKTPAATTDLDLKLVERATA